MDDRPNRQEIAAGSRTFGSEETTLPYLSLLLVLSGLAGSLAHGSDAERVLWNPAVFARATVVDAFHTKALCAGDAFLGVPYHYAGIGAGLCPTREHLVCADCSGLLCAIYATVGVRLPHSSARLAAVGEAVSRAAALPGDLLLFRADGAPDGDIDHAGIYLGNGLFLHAGSRGVRLDDLDGSYWGGTNPPRLRAIRRVLPPGAPGQPPRP